MSIKVDFETLVEEAIRQGGLSNLRPVKPEACRRKRASAL